MKPDVVMIGGANGAGKTTMAMALLPDFLSIHEFVNADEIARGLNPVKPETADMDAGRIMIRRIESLIAARKSFVFETTCSGRHHVKTLQQCRAAGYRSTLIFCWLPSADMAVARVKERVRQGGHDIPEETIRRRYKSGIRNLVDVYMPLVDFVAIFDNAVPPSDRNYGRIERVIHRETPESTVEVRFNAQAWEHILALAAKERLHDR